MRFGDRLRFTRTGRSSNPAPPRSVRVFVSRMLRSFEERGWVQLERERVTVVDPRALAQFAQD